MPFVKQIEQNKKIASIDNDFVIKACYGLATIESKLLAFLISELNSKNQKEFHIREVEVKELEKIFIEDGKKHGDFYKRLKDVCVSIMSKPIIFPRGFLIEGKPINIPKVINWFHSIEPIENDKGNLSIRFIFHDYLKPFLLSLKNRFVQIDVKNEYFPFVGKHTLNIYPAFKAARNEEKARYENSKQTTLVYGLEEFKAKLGLSDKYKSFKNLRLRVIEAIIEEINEKSNIISLSYTPLKNGKRITALEFTISDVVILKPKKKLSEKKNDTDNYIPSIEDLAKLTYAQEKAYEILTDFGIFGGIAYRQIIPTIRGANMEGYEDLFCEEAIKIFETKEKGKKNAQKSAGVFVKWWCGDKQVFSIQKDLFHAISERVHERKKKLDQKRQDNRQIAKNMTAGEFSEWYKNKDKTKK